MSQLAFQRASEATCLKEIDALRFHAVEPVLDRCFYKRSLGVNLPEDTPLGGAENVLWTRPFLPEFTLKRR